MIKCQVNRRMIWDKHEHKFIFIGLHENNIKKASKKMLAFLIF